MRASDIAFITTFCKCVAEKSGIAIFSFIRTYFHVKKAKKSQKARHIFKVSHLEMRPKKDQLKFFRSTNLKRGQSGNPAQEPQARRDYATWLGIARPCSASDVLNKPSCEVQSCRNIPPPMYWSRTYKPKTKVKTDTQTAKVQTGLKRSGKYYKHSNHSTYFQRQSSGHSLYIRNQKRRKPGQWHKPTEGSAHDVIAFHSTTSQSQRKPIPAINAPK